LQNLCDAIADRIADHHGDSSPLLSGDASEHERGKQMVRDLFQSEVVNA
jgi:hypothetical protein